MTNDNTSIKRVQIKMRMIRRILCKNNPNGRTDPDRDDNNDEQVFVDSAKTINPKAIIQEMKNLAEMFNELRAIVEGIEDIGIKTDIENEIDALEDLRRDIRNENQDKLNAKKPADDAPKIVETFLVMQGGANSGIKDWT